MKRFKNILCVVNTLEACAPVVERAVTLAGNNHADLTVIEVVPPLRAGTRMPKEGPSAADLQAALVAGRERGLETLLAPYRQRLDVRSSVRTGTLFLEVVREVLRKGHDLVIKAPEDPSWLERLFGSDDMHLLRKCPCPVWLTKAQAPQPYRRVLAALDVDVNRPDKERAAQHAMNRQILEIAGSLALTESAELHVAHAWEAIGESIMRGALLNTPEETIAAYIEGERRQCEAGLDALVREASGAADFPRPRIHLPRGSAREQIPALARRLKADLVVMGTVVRTGIPGLIIGNTAEMILDQLACSVLAVKPPGFVTPVVLQD
jgi:nucleotide-binding universal stress UspA family protein